MSNLPLTTIFLLNFGIVSTVFYDFGFHSIVKMCPVLLSSFRSAFLSRVPLMILGVRFRFNQFSKLSVEVLCL
jgi:hypothetical protein